MKRFACTTDYVKTYAKNYYAHSKGSSSFSKSVVPELVSVRAARHGSKVLDCGGGNGALSDALKAYGTTTFTLDFADLHDDLFQKFDFSQVDFEALKNAKKKIFSGIGETYLVTCFDVAEHIDREDIAAFVQNMEQLIDQEAIISISTRPSSLGNRFHSSIIPISTWKKLFEFAGFATEVDEAFNQTRMHHVFSGADEKLIAVSHWQRTNPFKEDSLSCQYYLRLRRRESTFSVKPSDLTDFVHRTLDIKYRWTKREQVASLVLPKLFYYVNFIQDWPFLRSILDVCDANDVFIAIREDTIPRSYIHLLRNYLERTGCQYKIVSTVNETVDALKSLGNLETWAVVTATDGLLSPTHFMGSSVLLAARELGAKTLSMQHGMNVLRSFYSPSANIAVWDEGIANHVSTRLPDRLNTSIKPVGSPRFLDGAMPSEKESLENRLGEYVGRFDQKILVGLNLHWGIHQKNGNETVDWIKRLSSNNPNKLFIIRPHPEDSTVYERPELFEIDNVVVLDELALLALDWTVDRLVASVDIVVSTFSTLVLNAAAAKKPFCLLPMRTKVWAKRAYFPLSCPWSGAELENLPIVSESEFLSGAIPEKLFSAEELEDPKVSAWFASSSLFWSNLSLNLSQQDVADADLSILKNDLNARASFILAGHNFDMHPHRNRQNVNRAIEVFCSKPKR